MKEDCAILTPEILPSLSVAECLDDAFYASLEAEEDIVNTHFAGVTFKELSTKRITFSGCRFEKCIFVACESVRFDFADCAFSGCDLASMDFDGGVFHRVSFKACRAVGMHAADALLRNVTFEDCQMAYANFGLAKLFKVAKTCCDLSHASFGEAQFKHVCWERCRLGGAELFGTRLRGMDLRSNEIDGIVLGDRMELEGAVVTPQQACGLALLLGLKIE